MEPSSNPPLDVPATPLTDSTPGKYCFACGKLIDARAQICPACGVPQSVAPTWPASISPNTPSWQSPTPPASSGWQLPASPTPGDPGRGLSIASIVFALISTLLFPIVFGPLAIILAAVASSRHERWWKGAMVMAVVCMLIGFVLGAYVALNYTGA